MRKKLIEFINNRFQGNRPIILLICLGLYGIPAINPALANSDSGDLIEIESSHCKINITKEPFQVSIGNHKGDIVKIVELFSEDETGITKSSELLRWTGNDENMNLIFSGTDGKFYNVNIHSDREMIEIEAGPVDRGRGRGWLMRFTGMV